MNLTDKIADAIKHEFLDDPTGHDWHHIQRVLDTSRFIHSKEGGDLQIIELSALLHDISDYKFNGGDFKKGGEIAAEILERFNVPEASIQKIRYIVDNISYKGANTEVEMNSLEGQIVQDADRLDAIGAIGIARVFAYGGNKNQPIYDPDLDPKLHNTFEDYAFSRTTSINHFYEKLLLLRDRLNTETARKIGDERHTFMVDFLDQFYKEWFPNKTE